MPTLKFTKMHGLGNDFMVVDGINQSFSPNKRLIAQWADRHLGVGFDQLLLVETAEEPTCDFRYRIFNADGTEVEQCGNGARCFLRFVQDRDLTDKDIITVETSNGQIRLTRDKKGHVTVDMGEPKLKSEDIPFTPNNPKDKEALTHIVTAGVLAIPLSCVNMGNPHAVVLVDDLNDTPVAVWGEVLESHTQFPERVNVGFMQIIARDHIKLDVFERGVGQTNACGTGACAAVVAGIRLGLLDDKVMVSQMGGDLIVEWKDHKTVLMSGPATVVYEGEISYS